MVSVLHRTKDIDPFIAPAGKGFTKDPLVGRDICGYKVLSRKTEGGMGIIYEAVNLFDRTKAALKTLSSKSYQNPHIRARFERECLVLPELDHTNIVRAYGGHSHDYRLFLAMEFLEGMTLNQMFNQNMLSWPLLKEIFPQICDALAALHNAGYIHRDVSPENLLIRFTNPINVKLLDFGFVCLVDARDWKKFANRSWNPGLTDIGVFFGTPPYNPPDWIYEGACKPPYDIYSLGAILHELVTGKKIVENEDRLPSEIGLIENTPVTIDGIIARALQKKPENRFQSALEFKQAFLAL